jgi:LysR family glycine cleavage system transcriptional activator
MSRLPPFDALIAFETVARLGGMTRAAEELNLTQSAVSHRIRRLEDFMGTSLLKRQTNGITPTAAGSAVLENLKDILDRAADLRSLCLSVAAPDRLRVGVGSALADHWLVRRLPLFSARYPATSIELTIVENEVPERAAGLDLRILWRSASEARPSSTQRALFREHVFPVCSPAILPKGFTAGDPKILTKVPLLHKRMPGYDAGAEWSWEAWFDRLNLKGRPREAFRFASIGPAISAALEGAGAALARSMIVADALAEGRLVRLLPPEMDQLSQKVHVVRWPGRLAGDKRVETFAAWLAEMASGANAMNGKRQHRSDSPPVRATPKRRAR